MFRSIPTGSRPAARVVLIDENDRVLYLHALESSTGKEFWVLPGGGLESQESFEEAAVREVREETGLEVDLGTCVWTRHHIFEWQGKPHDQYEVFFVSRVVVSDISPPQPDDYVIGHEWWTHTRLKASKEKFAPRRIADLLSPILIGNYPAEPFDCGV